MPNEIKPSTFCQRVAQAAGAHADEIAMVMIEPSRIETVTFGSMLSQIRGIAYRLGQEKIDFGDRVAIIGENHPNWAIAYLGILYRGAVATPLDPASTSEVLAHFLKDADAKLAFISPASLSKFRAACEQLGRNIPAVALKPLAQTNGLARFDEWANTPTPREFNTAAPPAKSDDLALLMYTSGTTGMPKAVPLTHGNIYAESDKIQEVMHVSDREIVLSLLPLFHVYSQIVNLWLATIIGGRIVYLSELSSAQIERALRESGATALVGVPRLWYLFHKKIFAALRDQSLFVRAVFNAMLAVNGWLRDWIGINAGRLFFQQVHRSFGGRLRLAVSGGASFDIDVARDFHRLGFTILQGYGLTETCGAATVTRFEDNMIGSVGTPLNGVEIKIDGPDEEGVGEVFIRGPVVTSGYYHNPEANREAFTSDGWFRSGDLGRCDKQGHLFIVGRKKDVVKLPSGKNVFPEDVEAHYERSPFVSEICVLGVRDETSSFKGAEKLCGVVVPNFDYLKAQHIANAKEWIVWELDNLGQELPEYQRVHEFVLRVDPLPRTTTRKIRRFEVRDQLQTSGALKEGTRPTEEMPLTPDDQLLMDSPAGRALVAAIKQNVSDTKAIHPQMNLEIDVGLDSLARAECTASLEQAFGIEFKAEELTSVQTVADLIHLTNQTIRQATLTTVSDVSVPQEIAWGDLLRATSADFADVQTLRERKRFMAVFGYLVMRLIHGIARFLLRMRVRGSDVLDHLQPPYLVCPNHQSYVDPFLLCSTYPRRVLQNIFHVGAAIYFRNAAMARLARLINVIPIDTDIHLVRAMRAGAAGLRAGKILNIYPEGQRSFDGQLHEFKKGAAILATELNVPIVPVALDGTHRIWPRESWRPRLASVKISFGEPIFVRDVALGEEDHELIYEKLTAALRESIQQMLTEMRKTNA